MKWAVFFDPPSVLLVLLSFGMVFVFPFFAFFIFGFVVSFFARDSRVGAFFAFLTATLLFSWMNSNKGVAGDWDWYTHHYYMMKSMDIYSYFEATYSGVQARLSEPVYHVLAFALAKITSSNVEILASVVSVVIYGVAAVASAKIARLYSLSSRDVYFVVFGTLFLGITFSLTTQLVRQQIAISILALSVMFMLGGRLRLSIFAAIVCVGTHNSSVFPLAAFYAVYFLSRALPSKGPFWVVVLSVCFFLFGSAFTAISAEYGAYNFVGKDDGAVGLVTFIYDAVLVCGLLLFWYLQNENKPLCRLIFFSFVVYLSFVIGTASDPLAFLRMYFYVETFRILMISVIVASSLRYSKNLLVGFLFCIVGVFYCFARVDNSPFDFKGNVFDYIFYSPF